MNLFVLFLIVCFLGGPRLSEHRIARSLFLGFMLLMLVVAYYYFNQI